MKLVEGVVSDIVCREQTQVAKKDTIADRGGQARRGATSRTVSSRSQRAGQRTIATRDAWSLVRPCRMSRMRVLGKQSSWARVWLSGREVISFPELTSDDRPPSHPPSQAMGLWTSSRLTIVVAVTDRGRVYQHERR